VLFFFNIDISITNVTIIFLYIFLVFLFIFNGRNLNISIFNSQRLKFLNSYLMFNAGDLNVDLDSIIVIDKRKEKIIFSNTILNFILFLLSSSQIKKMVGLLKGIHFNNLVINCFIFEFDSSYLAHKIFLRSLKSNNFNSLKKSDEFELYFVSFLSDLFVKSINFRLSSIQNQLKAFNVIYLFINFKNFSKSFVSYINIFVFENIYNVLLNMVKENISGNIKRSVRFFPFIFSLFIFILIANLIGLIPYSSTITSYLIVTFAMAIMVLLGVNVLAGRFHGLMYFGHFLPSGCPFLLYPLIIPIEFISYVFRVVSLSVRLFANMMAGHTLLAVLAGFGWTMATGGNSSLFSIHFFPILVVFILVFLETAVAIIQSYVFTILTCMYLDEAINLH
jgi:ATP synthase subunit 6